MWKRAVSRGLLLGILAAGGWVYYRIQAGKESLALQAEGERSPLEELGLENADGSRFQLSDLRGKPVVIDVWASWCGPCLQNLPRLVQLADDHAGRISILGLNVDSDGWEPVGRFRGRFPQINFPLVRAYPEPLVVRTLVTLPALGPVSVLPTAFLVDSEGRLAGKYVGLDQMEQLHRDIPLLLQ